MTLVLGFGNSTHISVLSDRRFTNWDGSGFSDENTKVASFVCADARLAVAFAGLAKAPGFDTAEWILDALIDCSKPDYLMGPSLYRFGQRATQDFSRLSVDARFLRTTFLFAGYHHAEVPPRMYYWHISNYESPDGTPSAVASRNFSVTWHRDIRPLDGEPTMIISAGNPLGLDRGRIAELRGMLIQRKAISALREKGVSIIRFAAADLRSQGSIGKQISAVTISPTASEPIGDNYHTFRPTNTAYMANCVTATPLMLVAFRDIALERVSAADPQSPPMLVPQVGRRSPCSCGSGNRYKNCCGKKS